jgi:outer membrane protein insertion porin family
MSVAACIGATTAELQSASPGIPNEYGLGAAAFVDAGSVFRYSGSTASPQVANKNVVHSSVGAGLTWASPSAHWPSTTPFR